MKILIMVFSPTGNTNKVAEMLANALIRRGAEAQRIDLSREDIYFDLRNIREFLDERVEPHDCICVGGPVYAGRLQNQVKNIIRALPPPGGKWGKSAVPFVTWGGISSGVALCDAAKLLKHSGRIPALGMKIVGRHSLTRKFADILHDGKPGDETLPFVNELAERILEIGGGTPIDISKCLSYQDAATKIMDLFFSEAALKPVFYPGVKVNPERCVGCGLCVKYCPVQRREMDGEQPVERKLSADCIYCGECFNLCPTDAIIFHAARMEWLLTNGGRGKGPLACREHPKNVVYPTKNAASICDDK